MSSPSSLPPPPPPGPPPTSPPGPPPGPPTGPPPPPPSSSVTSANYFFGFVITFVVLLLLFIGCSLGSWRRFRLIGTAWDMELQDIEGSPFQTRKRRRRLIRPTLLERWTSPTLASPHFIPSEFKWNDVQPISAALVWSRSKLTGSVGRRKSDVASTVSRTAGGQSEEGSGAVRRGVGATLRSYVCPRRTCERPSKPLPVQRPPPEAIQVAVMIAMPAQSSATMMAGETRKRPGYVGHVGVGEYQIGVVRIPWPSGDGT